ncbi:unnamed protein product [Absidia cylindrospora]
MSLENYHIVSLEGGNENFIIDKRYSILRKVGSGSYGSVCSAINTESKEVVAIKKCLRIFDRKLITKRCLREVKLLQHFNGHPHIVALRDMDIVDYSHFNEIYLVLECCDTTMSDIIHSNVPLEPVHYRWFMYQIFSALHYIHSANVLHRDLKPSNILVNQNCTLRICDFGMARGFVNPTSLDLPSMTHYVVTRWYRAPEIMISNSSYDKAIDMWSAGCIFAELLGRRVLFKGNDYVDQLKKIIGILGLPEDTSFWDETISESVIEYIRNLRNADGAPPPSECIDFYTLFPNCPKDGIDLMVLLLQLDPKKRLQAESALSHPYVSEMRDPAEEMACPVLFDFNSFEHIVDQEILRACIVDEVVAFKSRWNELEMVDTDFQMDGDGGNCSDSGMTNKGSSSSTSSWSNGYGDSLMATDGSSGVRSDNNRTTLSATASSLSSSSSVRVNSASTLSKRRYTGSSTSTPISASATEAHLHALAAVQEGRGVPIIVQQEHVPNSSSIMESEYMVGEPEDMNEDDIQAMHSDESVQLDYHRRLLDPADIDTQVIERHLSRNW